MRTEWDYDVRSNVLEERAFGRVDRQTGADLPGDERITTYTYATPNSDDGPRDRIAEPIVADADADGVQITATRTYYDGEPEQGPRLHLLVALSMAAPSGTPACAADDLHCSATVFAAKARRAKSDAERVEYLDFATRAYLALAEQAPNGRVPSRDLCQAKQLIEQALALPATQLRGRVVALWQKSKPDKPDGPRVVTAAILDRLATAVRLDIDGPSYRQHLARLRAGEATSESSDSEAA